MSRSSLAGFSSSSGMWRRYTAHPPFCSIMSATTNQTALPSGSRRPAQPTWRRRLTGTSPRRSRARSGGRGKSRPNAGAESQVGEHFVTGAVYRCREFRAFSHECVGDLTPMFARHLGTFPGEDRLQERHDRRPLLRAGMEKRVGHPMGAASLLRGEEHLGGRTQSIVIVGEDQRQGRRAGCYRRASDGSPSEHLGFRWTDGDAERLAAPVAVETNRDCRRT